MVLILTCQIFMLDYIGLFFFSPCSDPGVSQYMKKSEPHQQWPPHHHHLSSSTIQTNFILWTTHQSPPTPDPTANRCAQLKEPASGDRSKPSSLSTHAIVSTRPRHRQSPHARTRHSQTQPSVLKGYHCHHGGIYRRSYWRRQSREGPFPPYPSLAG